MMLVSKKLLSFCRCSADRILDLCLYFELTQKPNMPGEFFLQQSENVKVRGVINGIPIFQPRIEAPIQKPIILDALKSAPTRYW